MEQNDIFQNGNHQQMNCIWHSIDELPEFNDKGITPLIIDSYYGHIGGEAHSYTRWGWQSHIETHKNREFMWAYESDLFQLE